MKQKCKCLIDYRHGVEEIVQCPLCKAAPELLEACQTVIKQRERQTAWLTLEDAEKIKVAIAKATGGKG